MARKKIYDIRPPQRKKPIGAGGKKGSLKLPSLPSFSFSLGDRFQALLSGALPFVLGFLVLLGGFLFLHFRASAKIVVFPAAEPVSFKKEVTVKVGEEGVNFNGGFLPGEAVFSEKEVSEDFSATGVSETATKARGKITVINDYNLSQILVEDTRFLSADSKLFYSTQWVEVPAGGEREIEVVAADPGPEYNIKATSFSIPGLLGSTRYTSVYGESKEAMKGGSTGEVSIVTAGDFMRAEEKLEVRTEEEVKEKLKNEFKDKEVLDSAVEVEVLDTRSSADEGEVVDNFSLTVNAKAQTVAFKREDLRELVLFWAEGELQENEEVKADSLKINSSVSRKNLGEGTLDLEVRVEMEAVKKVDENELKKSLLGKSERETRAYLSDYEPVEKAEVRLSPFWIRRIPQNPEKVELEISN